MARKANVLPSYLLHKKSGQARVRLNGRDVYLGPYGSEESRIRYAEIVSSAVGGVPVDPISPRASRADPRGSREADPGPTVGEVCLVFLQHAKSHYVKNGKQTSEVHILRSVIRPLNDLYGLLPAAEFGPLALKAVRQKMIEAGWCRSVINQGMSRIRRIFKHAIANELIEPAVLQKLQAVAPLLAGRTEAEDREPRRPVSDEDRDAVRRVVSVLVRDLIDLQYFTGARSGELLGLCAGMVHRSEGVWVARLSDHKTSHHGAGRELHFGPQAQRILGAYLEGADPSVKLFAITGAGYRRAITRACDQVGVRRWVPHELRHSFASRAREVAGLEAAQAALGHRKADMTEHYAGASRARAAELAARIG